MSSVGMSNVSVGMCSVGMNSVGMSNVSVGMNSVGILCVGHFTQCV